jgi:carbon monoxide dehydrogenase subunit G
MAIKVDSTFLVPASIDDAWTILTDVPRIAPCMPGAEITEAIDAHTYKGLARVKVGPMQLAFSGEAKLHDLDPAAHTSHMSIRGADTKGRGNVHSEMVFSLAGEAGSTRVNVVTEISLSGAVAQYGRGAGLIKEICNQFAAQFAKNLAAQIESGGSAAAQAKPLSALGLVGGAVRAMVTRSSDDDPSKSS